MLGALWMASWKKRLFQIEYTGGFKMQVLREFLVLVLSATVIVPFVNLLLIMGEVCCSYSGRLLEDRLLGKEQVLLPKA